MKMSIYIYNVNLEHYDGIKKTTDKVSFSEAKSLLGKTNKSSVRILVGAQSFSG